MFSSLDETILSFSEGLFKIIKIMKVSVSDGLLDLLDPLISLSKGIQVINSSFVGENQHEWVKNCRIVLEQFFSLTFNENTCQTLHIFMLLISLIFVRVKFLTEENIPVFSKLTSLLLFFDDLSFDMDRSFTFALLACGLVKSHWKTTDTMGHATTITSWGEEIILASTASGCEG